MAGDTDDPNEQRDRIIYALRVYGTAFTELGRKFGSRMGLHTTDATALIEILQAQDNGAPLTQSKLSHRIGLSGGATSSLLNRLEDAGHVRRTRDSADRRLVTLHAADGVDERVERYFEPLAERIGTMLEGFSPEMLTEFERFLTDVGRIMTDYIEESAAQDRT